MYDPATVFTKAGLAAYRANLFNLEQSLNYVVNHADDLHIGALDDSQLEPLHAMQRLLASKVLEVGDGEAQE